MANKLVLAKLALGLYADSSQLVSGLKDAQGVTAKATQAMTNSLSSFHKASTKELGGAGREFELLEKKQQLLRQSLEKTANTSKNEATRINAQLKLISLANDDLAKHFKKNSSDMESAVTKSNTKIISSLNALKAPLAALGTGLVAAVGVGSLTATIKLADQYNVLSQRIKTATKETGDYKAVSQQLYEISQKNGASLRDTVGLFQNLSRSRKELGVTNGEILKLTNTIQQLGIIGGSSGEEMSNALRQFSQSMAGGIVRAEEFNSIVENMPELAHRIGVGMGLTDAELRKLMLSGKLLSKDVLASLQRQAKEIEADFSKMPKSVDRAFQSLTDKAGLAASKIDQVTGSTKLAVAAMESLGSAVDRVANAVARIPNSKMPGFLGGRGERVGDVLRAGNNQGWGLKKLGDDFHNLQDLGNSINPFIPANKRPTLQQVADNYRNRKAGREAQQGLDLGGFTDPNVIGPDDDAPSKKYPGLTGNGVDEKAAAKAKKKHDADIKHADSILANLKLQNDQIKAKLASNDQLMSSEKALFQLAKDKTLSDKEKVKYAQEINKLAAEHAALVRQEKIEEEKKKLADILQGYREKAQLLKNEIAGATENNAILQAQAKIQDTVKVGMKETAAAQSEILAAAKEVAILNDSAKLKELEDSMRAQLENTEAKNNYIKQLIPILDAEKKIRAAITSGMENNVEQQKRIRDIAREMSDLMLSKQAEEEKKKIDAIGASLAEQNEQLKMKLAGTENLSKFAEAERDIQKEIVRLKKEEAAAIAEIQSAEGISGDEKTSQIDKVKQAYSGLYDQAGRRIEQVKKDAEVNSSLNAQLDAQDKLLDNIKTSTGSYKQKLQELDKAYASGNITQKQWQKTADELWKTQSKANSTIGDGVKQIGNNFTQAILNGQKLTDVFKNMGKALAALAAQKFIFEPLARGMDGLAAKMFGTGAYTPKPVLPGASGLASGGQTSGMLNTASGGPTGGGGLVSTLGTLGSGAMGFFSKLFGGKAMGGDFSGFSVVGEQGPELVYANRGAYVANNRQYQQMSSYAQDFYNLSNGNANFGDNTGAWMANNARATASFDSWRASQRTQGYQLQMRNIWEQSQMLAADDMTRRTAGTKDQNSKGAMWAQSIRSKENFGMWGGGGYGWASGNQSVAELQKLQSMGVSIPDNVMAEAIGQDAVWNSTGDEYSTRGVGYLAQKSMQMGGGQYTGSTSTTAYGASAWDGGWGNFDEMQKAAGEEAYGQKVRNNYWKSILNSNPLGSYKGASNQYRNNVLSWSKFPKNYYGPGANSSYSGGGGASGSDRLSADPYLQNPWDDGWVPEDLGDTVRRNPIIGNWEDAPGKGGLYKDQTGGRYGYGDYEPENGTVAGMRKRMADWLARGNGKAQKGWSMPSKKASNSDIDSAYKAWQKAAEGMGISSKDFNAATNGKDYVKQGKNPGGRDIIYGSGNAPSGTTGGSNYTNQGIYSEDYAQKLLSSGPLGALSPMMQIASSDTVFDQQFKTPKYTPAQMHRNRSSSFDRWQTDPFTAGRINARMIQRREKGGPLAKGQMSIVGESGPELIVPTQPSYVVPNGQMPGGPKLNVIVNNNHSGADVELVPAPGGGLSLNVVKKVAQQVVMNNGQRNMKTGRRS